MSSSSPYEQSLRNRSRARPPPGVTWAPALPRGYGGEIWGASMKKSVFLHAAVTGAVVVAVTTFAAATPAMGEGMGTTGEMPDACVLGPYANCAGVVDPGLEFHGNLRGADFHKAVLTGADLQQARLQRTDFRKADLTFANFDGANLSRANLRGADVSFMSMRGAKARGLILGSRVQVRGDVRQISLRDSPVYCPKPKYSWQITHLNADFVDAPDANFSHVSFGDVSAFDSNLTGASFEGSRLFDMNLSAAHMNGANFTCAIFLGTDLSGADLTDANVSGADLSGATLCETTMPDGSVSDRDC